MTHYLKDYAWYEKCILHRRNAGGASANVAAAIAKLGGKSDFIGCVGDDAFGTFLIQTMKTHNVSTKFMQRSTSLFTTLAFVSLADDGERDFVFNRGADKELKYDTKLTTPFKNQLVHFGAATAFLGGDLQKAYNIYLDNAVAQNAFISFDPNFRTDLWQNNEAAFINYCNPFIEKADLAKFSLEEIQLISGIKDLGRACRKLHSLGAKAICITLGKEGTYLSTPNFKEQIPSISVKSIDTTGAGDAFIGCLLKEISGLENPKSILKNPLMLVQMIKRANIAGAITTTQYGAIAALPHKEQLDNF